MKYLNQIYTRKSTNIFRLYLNNESIGIWLKIATKSFSFIGGLEWDKTAESSSSPSESRTKNKIKNSFSAY